MKKHIISIIIIACGVSLFAQEKGKYKDPGDSRFVYMTSIGAMSGAGDIELPDRTLRNRLFQINVNQLIAYQFNPKFFMGVTLGMDIWPRTAFIPIGLNLSTNFIRYRVSPHWYLNAGYAFKWYMASKPETSTKVIHGDNPGPFIESGLGIKIEISKKVSMYIMAQYKMQHSSIKYSVEEPNEPDNSEYFTNRESNHHYHFAGVKIGVLYW